MQAEEGKTKYSELVVIKRKHSVRSASGLRKNLYLKTRDTNFCNLTELYIHVTVHRNRFLFK